MIDPQQDLFNGIRRAAVELYGYKHVFDGSLPPAGTEYPFVYLADSSQQDVELKDCVSADVTQTIHFWSNNLKRRGSLSDMMLALKAACRKLESTYKWRVTAIDQTIMNDDTTDMPLMHGILTVTFQLIGG